MVQLELTESSEAASGGAVTVDLDASLIVYVGLFLVLLAVLKPLLFDPMMALFEAREARIEGTRRKAAQEDERSVHALATYEEALAKARAQGIHERDALRAEAQKREAEILSHVRSSIEATLESGRASMASEQRVVREQLREEAKKIGESVAARVLGREVVS